MGVACIVLTVVSLIMCLIGLVWDGDVVVTSNDMDRRSHAFFHLLKTAVVAPTIVLLIFVFASHLRCNDTESTWDVKPHFGKWCAPNEPNQGRQPLKPEAEPQRAR